MEYLIAFKWPLVVVLIFTITSVIFTDDISSLITSLTGLVKRFTFKKGGTELAIEREEPEKEEQKNIESSEKGEGEVKKEEYEEKDEKSIEIKSITELQDEIVELIFSDKDEKATELLEEIKKKKSNRKKRLELEGIYNYANYIKGEPNSLERLKELAEEEDYKARALFLIASGLKITNQLDDSIEYYKNSIELTDEEPDLTQAYIGLSEAFNKNGETDAAINVLIKCIEKITASEYIVKIYSKIHDIYQENKSFELASLAAELAIENSPNDIDLLFDAGYSYSNSGKKYMSALHYINLLSINPDYEMARNNLGVTYESLDLDYLSILQYKRAWDSKETLAAANIAKRYLNEGFTEEAKKVLNEAVKEEDIHANVRRSFSRLEDLVEREQNQKKEILKKSRILQSFLKGYARKYFSSESNYKSLEGEWSSENGDDISISFKEEKIKGGWLNKNEKYKFVGPFEKNKSEIIIKKKRKISDDTAIYTTHCKGKLFFRDQNKLEVLFELDNQNYDLYKFEKHDN